MNNTDRKLKRTLHRYPTFKEYEIEPKQPHSVNSDTNRTVSNYTSSETIIPRAFPRKRKTSRLKLPVLLLILTVGFLIVGYLDSISEKKQPVSNTATNVEPQSNDSSEKSPIYNYYTWKGESSDTVSFINPADLGSQIADMREQTELYITNIAENGDLIGSEQEILIIPWREEWNDWFRYWGIGEFQVSRYSFDETSISYRYYYSEYSPETIQELRSGGILQEKEISGEKWSVFFAKRDNITTFYAIQKRDAFGSLVCELSYELQGNDNEAPKLEELLGMLVGNIEIKRSDFSETTAVSPFASRMIIWDYDGPSDNTLIEALVSLDTTYKNKLIENNEQLGGFFRSLSWDPDELYTASISYGNSDLNLSDTENERILYRFYVDYSFFNGSESKALLGISNAQNAVIGEEKITEINGLYVHYRLTKYELTSSRGSYPCETVVMWIELGDRSILFINDAFEHVANTHEEQVEEIVRRLAGDNLQLTIFEDL